MENILNKVNEGKENPLFLNDADFTLYLFSIRDKEETKENEVKENGTIENQVIS
jgi:hypothetical protein